jgi:hypothetical protein
MTDQNNAAHPGLTESALMSLESEVQRDIARFGPNVHIGVRAGLLREMLSKLRAEGVQAGDEWEAFEASYRERYRVPAHVALVYQDVPSAWEWWQRRAALASAPVADERAAQEYGSPADLAQRIEQYLAQDGRMNSGTQLLYEAMKALRSLAGGSK